MHNTNVNRAMLLSQVLAVAAGHGLALSLDEARKLYPPAPPLLNVPKRRPFTRVPLGARILQPAKKLPAPGCGKKEAARRLRQLENAAGKAMGRPPRDGEVVFTSSSDDYLTVSKGRRFHIQDDGAGK